MDTQFPTQPGTTEGSFRSILFHFHFTGQCRNLVSFSLFVFCAQKEIKSRAWFPYTSLFIYFVLCIFFLGVMVSVVCSIQMIFNWLRLDCHRYWWMAFKWSVKRWQSIVGVQFGVHRTYTPYFGYDMTTSGSSSLLHKGARSRFLILEYF